MMDFPREICDIVFAYWSPSKEIKKRVDYSASIMFLVDALAEHNPEYTEATDPNEASECLLNKIVTVPWGKIAYTKFEAILEVRFMIAYRDDYLTKGFNREQAWRLMMTHVRQFDL